MAQYYYKHALWWLGPECWQKQGYVDGGSWKGPKCEVPGRALALVVNSETKDWGLLGGATNYSIYHTKREDECNKDSDWGTTPSPIAYTYIHTCMNHNSTLEYLPSCNGLCAASNGSNSYGVQAVEVPVGRLTQYRIRHAGSEMCSASNSFMGTEVLVLPIEGKWTL